MYTIHVMLLPKCYTVLLEL